MNALMTSIIWLNIIALGPSLLPTNLRAAAVREAIEFAARKFGDQVLHEGSDRLAGRLGALVTRHGDDVLVAFRKAGPVALTAIESAGKEGGVIAKLFIKHGEEAAWIAAFPKRVALYLKYGDEAALTFIRHRQLAEPLVDALGQPAVKALAKLNVQNGQRLAILAEEGTLAQMSRRRDILGVIASYGDKAMDFVWRHKGALAVTAVLTAFVAEPKPFLNGTRDLASVVIHSAVVPLQEGAKEVVRQINWTLLGAILLSVFAVMFAMTLRRRILRWFCSRSAEKSSDRHL